MLSFGAIAIGRSRQIEARHPAEAADEANPE
jgi:hypothetical protein